MSDLQISDDMKMENFNEVMRLLRKTNRMVADIDETLENAPSTASIVIEEKVVIHNYMAFLYNNDLVANKKDIKDTLIDFLNKDNISDWLEKADCEHIEKFEDNQF